MEAYCVSCKKNTANENSCVRKTIQNRLMLLSNCSVCDKKNQLLLKTRNFHMISLELKLLTIKLIKIKLLTNFY